MPLGLYFSPFAALLAPGAELTRAQWLQVSVLRRLKGWFQLDNLLVFNRKFFPDWERRFGVADYAAQVVELRFFGGLNAEETAEVLGVSPKTVKRDWRFAKSWLMQQLSRQEPHVPGTMATG